MSDALSIYFAGDLFDHKDLIGNALLAAAIEKESLGRYKCLLPQDFEQGSNRKEHIRDQDLKMVMEADLGLFNFDGADLDSGTVVEFIVAKQLDIPSVVLRSDFRNAGDQDAKGDKWNLMCSFYPRTEIVTINGMEWYQEARAGSAPVEETIKTLYARLASQLIAAFDKARSETPLTTDADFMEKLYQWAVAFPGASFEDFIGNKNWVAETIEKKKSKGLIG